MDDHPIELTWGCARAAWQVHCPCGYIRTLWWARDEKDSGKVEALITKGWDPFRNLHEHSHGLVTLP